LRETLRLKSGALDWREIDGEVVALEAEQSLYLAGNPAATLLWQKLAVGATQPTLCETLVSAYAIDPDVAARDVHAFIEQARQLGLLEES
jgi:hypothetical protein